jgi:hypothetical protein
LRVSSADDPRGPYSVPSEPISGDWVEGPSVCQVGDEWLIYFDHYTKPHYYGALATKDFTSFRNVSKDISFPPGTRHGTALTIDRALLEGLNGK